MNLILFQYYILIWTLISGTDKLAIFNEIPSLVKGHKLPEPKENGNTSNSLENDVHDILSGFLECDFNFHVLLSQGDNCVIDLVSSRLTLCSVPFIHLDQNSILSEVDDFKTWFRDLYVMQSNMAFIVDVKTPASFLGIVDAMARNESRGELSLMRHKTCWLVACWSKKQMENMAKSLITSVLDNIAVVHVSGRKISETSTLKWISKKERALQRVTNKSGENTGCFLFPNKKLGLNGRTFDVLVKPYFESMLKRVESGSSNNMEYEGMIIDIFLTMGMSLNFSYDIYPEPGSNVHFNWTEYQYLISNGTYDVGLNIWADTYVVLGPHAVTYPIVFDVITGIYQMPIESERSTSIVLLFPFQDEIYYGLGLCLFGVAILHVSMLALSYVVIDGVDHQIPRKKIHILTSFLDIIGRLTSSLMNQSYLPRPELLSARLLLGFWSLTVVVFYALYSGIIIARMVKQTQDLPFHTYQEMANRGDYRWVIIEDSAAHRVMRKSSSSSGDYAVLSSQADLIPLGTSGTSFTSEELVDNSGVSRDDKLVLFHFKMAIESWLMDQTHPEDYVVMDNSLFSANGGLLLAENSDLARLMSNEIVRMHDTGLLDRFFRTHNIIKDSKIVAGTASVAHKNLNLNQFFWPFMMVFFSTMSAGLLLTGEIIFWRLKERRKITACWHLNHGI